MSAPADGPVQVALEHLAGFATADEPLAPYTTYKVGGPAAVFASPRDDEELLQIAHVVATTGLPTLVVGRGSNLLVADAGFPGIAISLAAMAALTIQNGPASRNPRPRTSTPPVPRIAGSCEYSTCRPGMVW